MTETMKIGLACFVGAAVCTGIALLLTPTLWWLGLAGGIAGGYLSGYLAYEFRRVLAALPTAFEELINVFGVIIIIMGTRFVRWITWPRPHLALGLVVAVVLVPATIEFLRSDAYADFTTEDWVTFRLLSGFMFLVSLAIPWVLSAVGAELQDKKYVGDTYKDVLRDVGIGLKAVVLFILWNSWKYLFMGIWQLIRLVHSRQRVLCGVDSVLGGLLTLVGLHFYGPAEMHATDYLVAMLFGGLIGAALGIANWELVSKRYFGYGARA